MPWATPPSICPRARHRVEHPPDLLHGDEVVTSASQVRGIDRDLDHVHRPGVGGVGVAACSVSLVPRRRRRRLVLGRGDERAGARARRRAPPPAKLRAVAACGSAAERAAASIVAAAARAEPADDHRRARGDRRPAVGHAARCPAARRRPSRTAAPARSADDLGEAWWLPPGPISVLAASTRTRPSPASSSAAREASATSPRAGEARAVEERRHADPALT